MIKKITCDDYLRRYDNMSLAEQQDYLAQVQEWEEKSKPTLLVKLSDAASSFQNVMNCSASWNDAECEAFNQGIKLLSAFAHKPGSWLPEMIYVKTASRVIRWMAEELKNCQQPTANSQSEEEVQGVQKGHGARRLSGGKSNSQQPTAKQPTPVRPKHIDQYVHLLPKKTQERAALIKDLLQQMDVARENARLLMNDEKSSPADRAKWASLATKCDKEVRSIYKELDKEWDKLVKSGSVIVDDLGNARIIDVNVNENDNSKSSASATATESAPATESATATESAPAGSASEENNTAMFNVQCSTVNDKEPNRRRQLRKWLVDTRRGNGDTRKEHVKKWKETFKEYVAIESETAYEDEKILAAAEHYGISLKQKRKTKTNKKK